MHQGDRKGSLSTSRGFCLCLHSVTRDPDPGFCTPAIPCYGTLFFEPYLAVTVTSERPCLPAEMSVIRHCCCCSCSWPVAGGKGHQAAT